MISVNENYRKQGIGSALLHNFFQEMMIYHIRLITLEVRTNNSGAIMFYTKYGFTIQETVKRFYQNGEDAFSMSKVL